MVGDGGVDVITQIKRVLNSLRDDLDDVQKLEVNANFALDDELNLAVNLGSKDEVVAAIEFLRAISPSLHSDSTPGEMAVELVLAQANDTFKSRLDDLRVVAAADRLAQLGLDGQSEDEDIAKALAAGNADYETVLSQQRLLLANPTFIDAMKTLNDYGFDRNTTDDDIVDALQTQPTEGAKDANQYLSEGVTGETSLRNQLDDVLIELGIIQENQTPTTADTLPDLDDPKITSLSPGDRESATTAINLLQASFRLEAWGLTGKSNDGEIDKQLANPERH